MSNTTVLERWIQMQEQRLATLAYKLHDGPCQYVTSAFYRLEGFRLLLATGSEDAWEDFDHGLDLLQRGRRELRSLMSELRPAQIGDAGVIGAIEDLIHENVLSYELFVAFSHNLGRTVLPPVLESTVFRIVQESLTNVRRHSHSQKARLGIFQSHDSLHIEVEDWGIGFDPLQIPKTCFGVEGIRARASLLGGKACITSRPRGGTLVTVDLPISQMICASPPQIADVVLSPKVDPAQTSH